MPITIFTESDHFTKTLCPAKELSPTDRKEIAVQAIGKTTPITRLAKENGTSRKFVYKQKEIADQALEEGFKQKEAESDVLFYLPVSKRWLQQFIVSLVLVCHSSYRGVVVILSDLFDYDISLGTVHNVLQGAVAGAKQVNEKEDLSRIKDVANDEIFQGNPVLAGCDLHSLYCYLLTQEEHRDGDTWGIRLLECIEKGLDPDRAVADFGTGLRSGHKEAMPGVPCLGDHFHILYDTGKLRTYLNNRAKSTAIAAEKLENKMLKAKKKGKGNTLSRKLAAARVSAKAAKVLADDISTLYRWMKETLSPFGPSHQIRQELLDFMIEELRQRESTAGGYRIAAVRRTIDNHKEDILIFARFIDKQLESLAEELDVDIYFVRMMYELQAIPYENPYRYNRENLLRRHLRGRFHFVQEAVTQVQQGVVRASSAIENFNSRLRNYFFLRKQIGNDYLDLLRFYLNHQSFLASDDPRRAGRSPAEIMLNEKQPHWLEQLGFELFKRAA